MFKGRTLLIATKHEKEKVIAPILEKELGVKCVVSSDFDTDTLGTFAGEVERTLDPLGTARQKCVHALSDTTYDLAIASEGSFGPHPTFFFSYADDEILLLVDTLNDIEIVVRFLTTETNFNAMNVTSRKSLMEFAKATRFPSHALILKRSKDDFQDMKKGITNWETLHAHFLFLMEKYQTAYVETDMRAMLNPSRMNFIEKVAEKLTAKIKTTCAVCNTPGFGITVVVEGLPCELCNLPTGSTLSYIYSCQKCDFTKEEKYPNGKTKENPMYCDVCNP